MTNFLITSSFNKNQSISPLSSFWKHKSLGQDIAENFYTKFKTRQTKRASITQKTSTKLSCNSKESLVK